jgi:hypothetical protein
MVEICAEEREMGFVRLTVYVFLYRTYSTTQVVKVFRCECVLLGEAPSSDRINCLELQIRFTRLAALM